MKGAHPVVLVADDNAENRALAQATLEDEGYRVVLAHDGLEAVAAFTRDRPACVLLDVRMPNLDGLSACERIRALPDGQAVAIVFVTAQRDVDTFDRALAAGGDDFITKPFRPSELVVRVQSALKVRQLAGERTELYAQIKRQRDDLQRLQLQKEQLVAFLIHDLKNPVGSIDLHAQRLLRDPGITERSRDAASTIRNETRSLTRMIMNLLDLAKADEGRLVPACKTLDPAALIREVFGEVELRAAAAKVTLAPEITAPALHGDPDLLHRVLANLIDNALRFAPEDTTVLVTASRAPTNDGVLVRVTDRGPGIAPEQRDRVFQRFESDARTATGRNRGLGLAFCKLAIEAHGGRIWVEDAAPGSVFCMNIPDAR